MYHWSDAATAQNLELASRGHAIEWLSYFKGTENVGVTLCCKIEPHFKSNCDIQIQTLDNLWVLSKLKHKEVLKLIKAPEY
jgi:hypothetical protein